jgi:peroxiredoxin
LRGYGNSLVDKTATSATASAFVSADTSSTTAATGNHQNLTVTTISDSKSPIAGKSVILVATSDNLSTTSSRR